MRNGVLKRWVGWGCVLSVAWKGCGCLIAPLGGDALSHSVVPWVRPWVR